VRHHFQTLEDLLATATKVVDEMCRLFPQIERRDMKATVLIYMLKNSTIEKP
jgi:hypothetical protein